MSMSEIESHLVSKHGSVTIQSLHDDIRIISKHDTILSSKDGIIAITNKNGKVSIDSKSLHIIGNCHINELNISESTIDSELPIVFTSPDVIINGKSLKLIWETIEQLQHKILSQGSIISKLQSKIASIDKQSMKPVFKTINIKK